MMQNPKPTVEKMSSVLWAVTGVLLLALLFLRVIFPELGALAIVLCVLLVGSLGMLVKNHQKALRGRTAAYGLNSIVTTLLVLGIVGVLDFLTSRYPLKLDLTKNKAHTLSDQTVKLVKSLKSPVKALYFAKIQQKDQMRPLLDNYQGLNPKFEVEYVDPDREPTRAKQAGIRKYGTLQLVSGTRDQKVEDVTEEKLTNALIKLNKEKSPLLCAITGHGERNFNSTEPEGYDAVRKALLDQSYVVKDVNLIQETKIPADCDAIAIFGPTRAFFPAEVKSLKDYLSAGGRAVVATDINLKGVESSPELISILEDWHVKPHAALIVDPLSRMLGVDASVAIVANFSKDNPITKEMQENCLFPFARPLEITASVPAGLHAAWIAQTTPKSWGVTHLADLAKGGGVEVKFTPGKDEVGPLSVAVTVEGKLPNSSAPRSTRLVVFGSSIFAINNFSRHAANLDFVLNSVSWLMEDENLISIRTKEEAPGKIELSQKTGSFVFLITVVVIPLFIAISGLVVWLYRRKL